MPKARPATREEPIEVLDADAVIALRRINDGWAATIFPGWTEFGDTATEACAAVLAKYEIDNGQG